MINLQLETNVPEKQKVPTVRDLPAVSNLGQKPGQPLGMRVAIGEMEPTVFEFELPGFIIQVVRIFSGAPAALGVLAAAPDVFA